MLYVTRLEAGMTVAGTIGDFARGELAGIGFMLVRYVGLRRDGCCVAGAEQG
ncbi:MAG: hypothetical protein ACP5E5_06830 [Acidobacteriaceae bacterium]